MNKSQLVSRSRSIFAAIAVFSFVFVAVLGAYAASTIGTDMSTTGTFLVNPAANSTTSVRFQNAAGANYFIANSTNGWIGVGAAPSTTFEVQGTASASYLMTANSLQVAGVASVAYSRFGTGATGRGLSASNDVLITGKLEVDGDAFFDAKASVSGNFQTSGRFIADTAASHSFAGDLFVTKNLIVGSATASSSGGAYIAEFSKTATASIYFGSSDGTKGSCLQLTNTAGGPVYARVIGTTWTVNATPCR